MSPVGHDPRRMGHLPCHHHDRPLTSLQQLQRLHWFLLPVSLEALQVQPRMIMIRSGQAMPIYTVSLYCFEIGREALKVSVLCANRDFDAAVASVKGAAAQGRL